MLLEAYGHMKYSSDLLYGCEPVKGVVFGSDPRPVIPPIVFSWPGEQVLRSDQVLVSYQLIYQLGRILDKYKVKWWAEGGTLIGAWRHHGLMRREPDIDIAILDEDWHHLSPGSPMNIELAYENIMLAYRPSRFHTKACFNVPRDIVFDEACSYTCGIIGFAFVDIYIVRLHGFCKFWKYVAFPDSRYQRGTYSLDGLFEFRLNYREQKCELVEDQREKWPFGETFVYVPRSGSIAASQGDYLDQVYGNDWRTTIRLRDPTITTVRDWIRLDR